jgi:hypothetical protein
VAEDGEEKDEDAHEEEEEEEEQDAEEDGGGGSGDQDNDYDAADASSDYSEDDKAGDKQDLVKMSISETEEAWLYAAAALGANNSLEVARRAAAQLEVRMAEFALVNATATNATTNVTINATPDARADCIWYASAQEDELLNSIQADAAVAVFLQRGAANATYAHAFSAACGIISPFRRFSTAQITDVFGIALLRTNEISSEMAHFVATHVADADFATGDANELPWRAHLDTPWLAPYRDEDLEQQYYIRHSSPVRGFGLFAARALPAGTVIGQYTGQFRQSVMDTDFAWSTHYLPKHDTGSDNVDLDHDGLELPALDVQLDSRSRGNSLRFVNDDRLRLKNCESVSVIRNNLWHIFYRTTAPIAQDEELFISYGAHYWKLRE